MLIGKSKEEAVQEAERCMPGGWAQQEDKAGQRSRVNRVGKNPAPFSALLSELCD